jgi:4-hydroxy-2-oxoheptanedioate aldolase
VVKNQLSIENQSRQLMGFTVSLVAIGEVARRRPGGRDGQLIIGGGRPVLSKKQSGRAARDRWRHRQDSGILHPVPGQEETMKKLQLAQALAAVVLAVVLLAPTVQAQQSVRLNRMIELWEQGKPALGSFARFRDADGALYYAATNQDFVIFDLEHGPADFAQLRVFLQFMLDRGALLRKGNAQPNVVPLARIPSNGGERNQWVIKQVLDLGVYGFMAPHIKDPHEARALVANARYTQKLGAPDGEPAGERGVSPANAARYWGIPVPEYFERADAWPLDPRGELAVIAMIESREGVENVRRILTEGKGIAAVFIGPYDLSTSLGYPGQPDHPETEKAIQHVLAVTKELKVPCGILVNRSNIEKRLKEGFQYLVAAGSPGEIDEAIRLGRSLSGRD